MKFIDYSIDNPAVVRFLVILLIVGGLFSYVRLGKLEDPEFKIKEALVVTLYPEAEAHSVELYVTDVIEQALQKNSQYRLYAKRFQARLFASKNKIERIRPRP